MLENAAGFDDLEALVVPATGEEILEKGWIARNPFKFPTERLGSGGRFVSLLVCPDRAEIQINRLPMLSPIGPFGLDKKLNVLRIKFLGEFISQRFKSSGSRSPICLHPARGVIIGIGGGSLLARKFLFAAHEDRNAIVPTWNRQPMTPRFQAGRTASTKSISEDNGIDIIPGIKRINFKLQSGPQIAGMIMQPDFKEASHPDMRRITAMLGNFGFKNPAGDESDSR